MAEYKFWVCDHCGDSHRQEIAVSPFDKTAPPPGWVMWYIIPMVGDRREFLFCGQCAPVVDTTFKSLCLPTKCRPVLLTNVDIGGED